LTALSRFVLDSAQIHGALDAVSRAFHDGSRALIDRSLELMGLPLLPRAYQPDSPVPFLHEQFRRLDTDKILHVLIVSDNLSTYDSLTPFGNGSYPTDATLDDRLSQGLARAAAFHPSPAEVLGLLIVCGVARNAFVGLNGGAPDQEVLPFHLSEF